MLNDNNIDLYRTPVHALPAPFGYETRGIACPDGIIRLLKYPQQIWDWYDHFVEEKCFLESEKDYVTRCWEVALHFHSDRLNEGFLEIYYQRIVSKYLVYNKISRHTR